MVSTMVLSSLRIWISLTSMWHSLVRYWDGRCTYRIRTSTLSRLCVNNVPPQPTLADKSIVALRPVMNLPQDVYDRTADIHNSIRGHVGLKLINSVPRTILSRKKQSLTAWSTSFYDNVPTVRLLIDYGFLSKLIDLLVRPIIHLKSFIWITLDHLPKMPMVTSIYLLSLIPFRVGLNCSPPSLRQR